MGVSREIVQECENTPYKVNREEYVQRDMGLISTLFLTGGRVVEVLVLRRRCFELKNLEYVRVREMKVVKRYEKVGEYLDKEGTKRWITEEKSVDRGRFSFPKQEPLVPYLVTTVEKSEDYLFPSPKPAANRPHLTTTRAYQIVHDAGERLGLQLYGHWSRAQRACQLAEEYGFELHDPMSFFGWKNVETA